MGRVLPFIFVTTGLVAVAVFQAHSESGNSATTPVAEVHADTNSPTRKGLGPTGTLVD